jgi:hypothetical protein
MSDRYAASDRLKAWSEPDAPERLVRFQEHAEWFLSRYASRFLYDGRHAFESDLMALMMHAYRDGQEPVLRQIEAIASAAAASAPHETYWKCAHCGSRNALTEPKCYGCKRAK